MRVVDHHLANPWLAQVARRVELRARSDGRLDLADIARQTADALEGTDGLLLGCEYPTWHSTGNRP